MVFSLSEPYKVPSKKMKLVDSNLKNLELAEVPNKVHSKLITSHVLKIKSNIFRRTGIFTKYNEKFLCKRNETLGTKL